MRNPLVILVLCLCSLTNAVPLGLKKNMAIVQEQEDPMLVMAEDEEIRSEMMISRLNLPSNATSIRADITDGFSCDNKTYGYYADVENECQIFHVCLPVTYADGKENTFRWSFICPEETVFSQEYFTCMRSEDMSIDCEESFKYYELNRNFGMIEPEETLPADEPEEEMNMDEMPKQPPSLAEEEVNQPSIEAAPVKKQTVKVQNSNRRKTQANRVAIEAQRKKTQPLRRLPKPAAAAPAVVATTAKPVEEDSPILEQEVERTTLKYQRLTKRPIAVIPEQPSKPEEPKPEKEVIRQNLFVAQNRKRPQIFFPSFNAAAQTDTESKPLPYLKTDILLQKPVEPVVQNQAESQAQASEIKEVSIKPQVELKLAAQPQKIETLIVEKEKPAFVYIPDVKVEDQPITQLKSEISSLPENIPSRVEVVEIPIQKLDEPLLAEGSAVLAKIPEVAAPEVPIAEAVVPEVATPEVAAPEVAAPKVAAPEVVAPEVTVLEKENSEVAAPEVAVSTEPKPTAAVLEPIKGEEEEIPTENVFLKKIIAQTEKIIESGKPVADEKIVLDPIAEPELITLDEPDQSLQNLKTAEILKPKPESEQIAETIADSKIPERAVSDDIPLNKPEESLEVVKQETLLKSEAPVAEKKPEESSVDSKPEDLHKAETPLIEEPALVEDAIPEKPQEIEMALKINAPAAEIPEVEAEKQRDWFESIKPEVSESEVLETQPEKPVNVEASVAEPQIISKSDIPEVRPVETLAVEVPVSDLSLKDETPVPEAPLVGESSVPQLKLEMPPLESMQKQEKPAVVETSSSNEEIAKIVEPVVKVELPIETDSKPSDIPIEQIEEVSPEMLLSSEIHAEKSSENLAAEQVQEAELNGEKEIAQSATDNEEAQSLILDFISSLVNSENSNFEEQSAIVNELSSDSLPEASIPEPVVAEAEQSAKIQSQDDQISPLYIPMMPSNDQMYQIPVQVIETPEPEQASVQAPIVAEQPKLPLSVDDIVELVKESLDTPVEKENIVQEASNDDSNSQPESEEVKPIYHRYIELGSNLLKSEALTASEDEPVVVPTANEESIVEKQETSPELPKASEKPAEPEQLALKSDSQAEVQQVEKIEKLPVEEKPESQPLIESPKEGRSLNRFRMDPRKRRFLFRSDAS